MRACRETWIPKNVGPTSKEPDEEEDEEEDDEENETVTHTRSSRGSKRK